MKRKKMSYQTFTKESGVDLSYEQYQQLSTNPKILETISDWYQTKIINAQAHYKLAESMDMEDLNATVKEIEFASDGETLYMIYRGNKKKRRIIYESEDEEDDTQECMTEMELSKRGGEEEEGKE